jgi:hypothetical protein
MQPLDVVVGPAPGLLNSRDTAVPRFSESPHRVRWFFAEVPAATA